MKEISFFLLSSLYTFFTLHHVVSFIFLFLSFLCFPITSFMSSVCFTLLCLSNYFCLFFPFYCVPLSPTYPLAWSSIRESRFLLHNFPYDFPIYFHYLIVIQLNSKSKTYSENVPVCLKMFIVIKLLRKCW